MEQEIVRQFATGQLRSCGHPDEFGRMELSGTIDLAALANVTCDTLQRAFKI